MNRSRMSWLQAALLAAGFVLVMPGRAHAYVDPVSGSIILQVIAAGALAAAFTFRRATQRVRDFARGVWTRIRS
jgi:hypothetical protein